LDPFEYSVYKEEIIKTVVLFVFQSIRGWCFNPNRTNAEKEKVLTNDLVKYISKNARNDEQNFLFITEEPQYDEYTVDIAAYPVNKESDYTKNIIVFESKRLPAPRKDRENEYVVGKLGGILRFKLEKHGAEHEIVGMIGYVQSGIINDHLIKINNCISDLQNRTNDENVVWKNDTIINTIEHNINDGSFHGFSRHQRLTLDPILIHHLWFVL
jgi:hypothetical protein